MIPPLPAPLTSLNGTKMKAIIRGILKQHNLKWLSPKPDWWPRNIPFQNISNPPPGFNLKEIGVLDLNKS